jgi:flagellar biosynthesis/type III secretory pathway protein FliH
VTRVLKAASVHGVHQRAHDRVVAELAEEQERQGALAAAYASGFDDGRAAAVREGAGAAPRAAAALEHLVSVATETRVTTVDVTSRAVLAAAIDIAQWVLRHELAADSRSLLQRLEEAAHALLPSSRSTVTVSPADEAAVRGWAARHDVDVVVDAALEPGDARYDNGAGSAEVTVAAALRIAAEALGVDPSRSRG